MNAFYHHQHRQELDATQKPPLWQPQVLVDLFSGNRKHFAAWVATPLAQPHESKRAHRGETRGSSGPVREGVEGCSKGCSTVSLNSKVRRREEHIFGAPACNLITHQTQKGPSECSCSREPMSRRAAAAEQRGSLWTPSEAETQEPTPVARHAFCLFGTIFYFTFPSHGIFKIKALTTLKEFYFILYFM